MAHSYKSKGPDKFGESFSFNPDTRVLTIGNYSITLPPTGTNLSTLADAVAGVEEDIVQMKLGNRFDLPVVDETDGSLWANGGIVTVGTSP